jgi:predicted NAD/FAD-binding protein
LSVNGQPQWQTVTGGSQAYVDRLVAGFRSRIRTDCAATNIRRTEGGVVVRDSRGGIGHFDQVVLASHADETLAILGDATAAEHAALRAIPYQRNRAYLHKDPQFMPKRRRCWASWVYHSDGKGDEQAITVSYWMNRLQSIDERCPLFVTLNPRQQISDEHIFDEHEFLHPVFDGGAIAAQEQIKKMQGSQNTWFCGAWLGHGFHEDGLASGLKVANAINAMGRRAAGENVDRRAARTADTPEAVAAA